MLEGAGGMAAGPASRPRPLATAALAIASARPPGAADPPDETEFVDHGKTVNSPPACGLFSCLASKRRERTPLLLAPKLEPLPHMNAEKLKPVPTTKPTTELKVTDDASADARAETFTRSRDNQSDITVAAQYGKALILLLEKADARADVRARL